MPVEREGRGTVRILGMTLRTIVAVFFSELAFVFVLMAIRARVFFQLVDCGEAALLSRFVTCTAAQCSMLSAQGKRGECMIEVLPSIQSPVLRRVTAAAELLRK